MKSFLPIALLVCSSMAWAAPPDYGDRLPLDKVDPDALIARADPEDDEPADHFTFVWWIPVEYWESLFARVAKLENEAKMRRALAPYTVVGIVRATFAKGMQMKPLSEEALSRMVTVSFVDKKGKKQTLQPAERVDRRALMILNAMKPVLNEGLGPAGKRLHFIVLNNREASGRPLVTPYMHGTLVVRIAAGQGMRAATVRVPTPLNALYRSRVCRECGKKMEMDWHFCPWCGKKLAPVRWGTHTPPSRTPAKKAP